MKKWQIRKSGKLEASIMMLTIDRKCTVIVPEGFDKSVYPESVRNRVLTRKEIDG